MIKRIYKHKTILVIATVLTIIFGTIYGASQQIIRSYANDPQIQLAEDAANRLDHGGSISESLGSAIDPSQSLSPFIAIYDKSGKLVATSATTNPALPAMPIGVLKSSDNKTYYAVTWAPTANLRLASVTVSAHDYYVTVARSLTEVENRETSLMFTIIGGWLLTCLFCAFVTINISTKNKATKPN